MFKNYIKITWRNLTKSSVYSSINIIGLAIAVACCLLVFIFIRYEISFDAFHQQAENIYLLVQEQESESGTRNAVGLTPVPYGQTFKQELPGIKNFVRITTRTGVVERGESKFSEQLTFVDSTFLQVFDFTVKQNTTGQLLKDPGRIIITTAAVEKYFGSENPVGETMTITFGDELKEFIIDGVIENAPPNSSISFDLLLPIANLPGYHIHQDNYTTNLVHTYLEIVSSVSASEVESSVKRIATRHWPENEEEPTPSTRLIPLSELHFARDIQFGPGTPGNRALMFVMGGVSSMVLLIACVNFILLAMGRSAERGKEVGIRKVLGAQRKQLMAQFWGEMFIQILIAVTAGMIIIELLLPVFNRLTHTEVSWGVVGIIPVVSFSMLLVFIVGMLAGLYPAVLQSGFVPIKTLKSQIKTKGLSSLGRFLIVFQYALSIGLIISTMVMYHQLDYLKGKPLGYDGDQVVMIPTQQVDAGQYLDVIRNEAQTLPGIISVSATSNSFTQGGAWGMKEVTIDGKTVDTRDYKVDNSYLETLGIELLAGRNFSDTFPSDPTNAVIVNRAFVEEMGLEDPVSNPITFRGQREIIGVVENYHFKSLHERVSPLILHTSQGWPLMHIAVRLWPDRIQESIEVLEAKWKELIPDQAFSFHFLDEQMDQLYQQEERWTEIITYVSMLAILIASMGMFGLTSITTENRKKEIGIRKVLGASAWQVLTLISKNFMFLFIAAFTIAVPISYVAISRWLSNYAYHVELGWWMFALSGVISLFVVFAAISHHVIKAALINPVESLRSE